MSDTDGKKPLGLGGRSGQVKQSFSHGRSKTVVVEKSGEPLGGIVAASTPSTESGAV